MKFHSVQCWTGAAARVESAMEMKPTMESSGKEFSAHLSQLKQFPKQIIENLSVTRNTLACDH